jgi:predicted NAD/FAD-dependent oxidoreductase
MVKSIGIIGGGMAGLSAAKRLLELGHKVEVFDKGRGPGGRMSTRREPLNGGTVFFDHGAQYFTARTPLFQAQLDQWLVSGLANAWPDAGSDAFVGTPTMNAPVAALAGETRTTFSRRVDYIIKAELGWQLVGVGLDAGPFDAVIVAIPAEQAAVLLDDVAPNFAAAASACPSHACWTTMVSLATPVDGLSAVTRPAAGALGWIANNASKPGRPADSAWILQASPVWSAEHIDLPQQQIAEMMTEAWQATLADPLPEVVLKRAHLWRYARSGGTGDRYLWARETGIGVCGDWLIGPRVESAWLSGHAVAEAVHDDGRA